MGACGCVGAGGGCLSMCLCVCVCVCLCVFMCVCVCARSRKRTVLPGGAVRFVSTLTRSLVALGVGRAGCCIPEREPLSTVSWAQAHRIHAMAGGVDHTVVAAGATVFHRPGGRSGHRGRQAVLYHKRHVCRMPCCTSGAAALWLGHGSDDRAPPVCVCARVLVWCPHVPSFLTLVLPRYMQFFPAQQLEQCACHPEAPAFAAGQSAGRYPCCGAPALRTLSSGTAWAVAPAALVAGRGGGAGAPWGCRQREHHVSD